MEQGEAEHRTPAKPWAWPGTALSGLPVQWLAQAQEKRGSDRIAPGERSFWVTKSQSDTLVDIGRSADGLLGHVTGDVDDHADHPRHDRAGAVADQARRAPVGGE